jgi:hypothetical protein
MIKMKFHQYREPAEMPDEPNLYFSEVHKKFMLRGRDVTREQLLTGEKVGEGRPVPYKAPCPFYVLYDNEVYLIDKGYEQFIIGSLKEFMEYAIGKFIELNPERWID